MARSRTDERSVRHRCWRLRGAASPPVALLRCRQSSVDRKRVWVDGEQHAAALRAEQAGPAVVSGAQQRLRLRCMPAAHRVSRQGTASAADLAGLLSQAVRPQLRNAAKHEGYAVDVDGASVNLRGGTLDADELQLLARKMVACVAGVDAAIAAWGLESGLLLEVSAPSDDSAGDAATPGHNPWPRSGAAALWHRGASRSGRGRTSLRARSRLALLVLRS